MSLRYVILHHTGVPEPHFDLMFETWDGSDLATWRCTSWPIEAGTRVTRLKDHRRVYLSFEGDVSRGRGHVDRVAAGDCLVEIGADAVWRISLLSGAPPLVLVLRAIEGQVWEASPQE